jgi:hypothetical protein
MVGPRFEQTSELFQPRPLAAIELIKEEPIRLVEGRVAACDGGKSPLPPPPGSRLRGCAAALRPHGVGHSTLRDVFSRPGSVDDHQTLTWVRCCRRGSFGTPPNLHQPGQRRPAQLHLLVRSCSTGPSVGHAGKCRWPVPLYVLPTARFIQSDCSPILSGIRYEKDHHHHGHGHPAGGVDGTFSE